VIEHRLERDIAIADSGRRRGARVERGGRAIGLFLAYHRKQRAGEAPDQQRPFPGRVIERAEIRRFTAGC